MKLLLMKLLKSILLPIILLSFSTSIAQNIELPKGCFAGTNGTHPDVLSHNEARGVLLSYKWYEIEVSPGVFNFTNLNSDIQDVTNAGLKYTIAILGGAFGSPTWLIDSLGAEYYDFNYQNQDWRLPLWWDETVKNRLEILIAELGSQFADDNALSHVYVTQMTVNGVEGHLNGFDMNAFTLSGFTAQKWIESAKSTTIKYAESFPDKPIVFEVHEIDGDTIVPSAIINELYNDPTLCKRVGLGMWWISGKTSYQTNLIETIANFQGDKYAQVIGRSDQLHRFQDSLYSTVFAQAKELNIRYIEPWPYEFQHHTYDSLLQDFNTWADENFTSNFSCSSPTSTSPIKSLKQVFAYPNPTSNNLILQFEKPLQNLEISIFNSNGQKVLNIYDKTEIDLSHLPNGIYFIKVNSNQENKMLKVVKNN